MGKTINCETIDVTVAFKGQTVATLVVPAYTRSAGSLQEAVEAALDGYLLSSMAAGESMSLGDFALQLLTLAAQEPDRQTEEG